MSRLNPLLSDHYLITFKFNILNATMENEKCYYSRCLSESVVNKFKEVIVSHLPLVEYGRATEDNDLKFTSADIDCLINNSADILHSALDAVAPLKKTVFKHWRSAPWYNSYIRMLKQRTRKIKKVVVAKMAFCHEKKLF